MAFVKEFGADEAIDYHAHNWYEVLAPGSVDVVYDAVCQDGTGDLAYRVLKDGGRFITLLPGALASATTAAARPSIKQTFYMLNQTATADLDVLRGFVDSKLLRGFISETYDLDGVRSALNQSIAGHVVGKLAISVAASEGGHITFV
ncbi:unnamed protein product [Polarella glacialis]|uniref:Alcohol dehydrogenase-like C-terminal domain-containing protein n=1 Tax=Polarella glacialis TaxID=89957 RepID=A0A813FSQ2_POLGL|nr:unnamed protein product [Polarella glacialis]